MRPHSPTTLTRGDLHRWLDTGFDRAALLKMRSRLTWEAIAAVVVAIGAVGVGLMVFASLWEDVVEHDGVVLRDPSVLQSVIDHRSPAIEAVARFLTSLGSVTVLIPAALVVGVVLWWIGQRVVVAAAPAVSLASAVVVIAASKMIVGRSRPPLAWQLANERDASFPSGHSGNTMALLASLGIVLGLLVFRRPIARLVSAGLCIAVALAMGASRLVLGVHWPTDVLAGWIIGATCAVAATTVLLVIAARGRAMAGSDEGDGGGVTRAGRVHLFLLTQRPGRAAGTPSGT